MQVIKCTKKLQKEMCLTNNSLSESEPVNSVIGSWHANLVYIFGKKCVVFVNDKTLFNFIVPGVTRNQINKLSEMFSRNLSCSLVNEGVDEASLKRIMNEHNTTEFKNTDNKSVIGSMNDIALHYSFNIEHEGSLHTNEMPNIIKKLNRMQMSALKSVFPINALKDSL